MDAFASLIGDISNLMYGSLLIILLIGAGLYFTLTTKFVQIRAFKAMFAAVMEKPDTKGGVSSFQALMVSTASRVGTGNIVGVASAICLGGYGATFWMCVTAFLGGATAFVESTLAQIYKKRDTAGYSYGGPAYYIEAALHNKVLAIIFALALISTYAIGFNMLCAYNLQSTFAAFDFYNPATTPMVIGAVLAVLVGWVLFGGGRRLVRVTAVLVPIMGAVYVLVALVVLVMNLGNLPGVIAQIFAEAFNFEAIFGGFAGSCIMFGVKRGLYSNEAGVGSAPNAAAAADVSHPAKQGLVQMLSVFIDTLLLCNATAFMCMVSGVQPTPEMAGAPYVQAAMAASLGSGAEILLVICMSLFAFTTLIGNLYYVDNAIAYVIGQIPGPKFLFIYRILACLVIFAGCGMKMGLLWDISDVNMGFMAIINIVVILALGGIACKALDDYMKQYSEGKNPVFLAKSVGIQDKLDYWQE